MKTHAVNFDRAKPWVPEVGTPAYIAEASLAAQLRAAGCEPIPMTEDDIAEFRDANAIFLKTSPVIVGPRSRTHWKDAKGCTVVNGTHNSMGSTSTTFVVVGSAGMHAAIASDPGWCCRTCTREYMNA